MGLLTERREQLATLKTIEHQATKEEPNDD